MFVVIGFLVVFSSVLAGYTIHGGKLAVLVQISEFIIIGGAALGALMVGNKPSVVLRVVREALGLLRPGPFNRQAYRELLQALYDLFYVARREGLQGLEPHIEAPESSELFRRYPSFSRMHGAVAFLCDNLKVLLTGTVAEHHLAEILDLDLERRHETALQVPAALSRLADAMPGFGIVAAVLGVVITMGHIGGSAAEVGESIAAALVGTLLGVLLAYGVVGPAATALEERTRAEHAYLLCLRTALLSFARGDLPVTSVEFARRAIDPDERPSFAELEALTRRREAA